MELGKKILLNPTAEALVELPLPDCPSTEVSFTVITLGESGAFEITGADLVSDNDDEDGLIKIASRRANRVDLDVGPFNGPRVLVYLDAWYPGWHAYVDGDEAPLLRADDGFKAVALSGGTHHVAFVFRPVRVWAGITVSLITVTAAMLMLLFSLKRRARLSGTAPPESSRGQ
jgi:hypothetical protein